MGNVVDSGESGWRIDVVPARIRVNNRVKKINIRSCLLPNRIDEDEGVEGGIAVAFPNENMLSLRFWFTGVDCPNRLALFVVFEPKLNILSKSEKILFFRMSY